MAHKRLSKIYPSVRQSKTTAFRALLAIVRKAGRIWRVSPYPAHAHFAVSQLARCYVQPWSDQHASSVVIPLYRSTGLTSVPEAGGLLV